MFYFRSRFCLKIAAVATKTFSDSEPYRLFGQDEQLRESLGFARLAHRSSILRRLKALRSNFRSENNIVIIPSRTKFNLALS